MSSLKSRSVADNGEEGRLPALPAHAVVISSRPRLTRMAALVIALAPGGRNNTYLCSYLHVGYSDSLRTT